MGFRFYSLAPFSVLSLFPVCSFLPLPPSPLPADMIGSSSGTKTKINPCFPLFLWSGHFITSRKSPDRIPPPIGCLWRYWASVVKVANTGLEGCL